MAQSKPTLNPMTQTPKNKTEVTKPFMIAYMESEKATKEDLEWFQKIVSDPQYHKNYTNQLNNEPYTDIDIPKVRELFIKRFYSNEPNLKPKSKKKETFIEHIMNIKKD